MYEMTGDGWSFLVMGFTKGKADYYKWKYITAFNKMGQSLSDNMLFNNKVGPLFSG